MKKTLFIIFAFVAIISANGQTKENRPKFNLDFEQVRNNLPRAWNNFGNSGYTLFIDSINAQNGKYSSVIEYKGGTPGYKAWSFTLPNNYEGKEITLSGYIKTENVTEG